MDKIQDLNIYTKRMKRGLQDKLFFIPWLNNLSQPFIFIDYGCADGVLIDIILQDYPQSICVGLDCNEDMLSLASTRCHQYCATRAYFCKTFEELKELLLGFPVNIKIFNMSSVLHEVHHYNTLKEVEKFYQNIQTLSADYIFIRDMYNEDKKCNYISQDVYTKLLNHPLLKNQIKDFERYFGSIIEKKNCTHFLLKYKYLENWYREVKENYFPDIQFSYFEKEYCCIFRKEYQLPYLTKLWKEELDITLDSNTHIQLIYKKK